MPPTYLLAIVTSVHNDADEFLNRLFETSYAKSILTINFLLPHQNQSAWLMTTFMPFTKSCNSLQQYDVAVLTEQNYSLHGPIDLIYPIKLKDFHQCPIVTAVFHTPPFLIIKSERIGFTYDGLDTRILEQLATKFNFKLIYRMPRDKQDRGTIYANGTTTGCIKMVCESSLGFRFFLCIYSLGCRPGSQPYCRCIYDNTITRSIYAGIRNICSSCFRIRYFAELRCFYTFRKITSSIYFASLGKHVSARCTCGDNYSNNKKNDA